MEKYINSYYKEENGGRARADVIKREEGFVIEYFDTAGNLFRTEPHPGKSLQWAEDAAENWAAGIKLLNE
jgi:hypothetical protein